MRDRPGHFQSSLFTVGYGYFLQYARWLEGNVERQLLIFSQCNRDISCFKTDIAYRKCPFPGFQPQPKRTIVFCLYRWRYTLNTYRSTGQWLIVYAPNGTLYHTRCRLTFEVNTIAVQSIVNCHFALQQSQQTAQV